MISDPTETVERRAPVAVDFGLGEGVAQDGGLMGCSFLVVVSQEPTEEPLPSDLDGLCTSVESLFFDDSHDSDDPGESDSSDTADDTWVLDSDDVAENPVVKRGTPLNHGGSQDDKSTIGKRLTLSEACDTGMGLSNLHIIALHGVSQASIGVQTDPQGISLDIQALKHILVAHEISVSRAAQEAAQIYKVAQSVLQDIRVRVQDTEKPCLLEVAGELLSVVENSMVECSRPLRFSLFRMDENLMRMDGQIAALGGQCQDISSYITALDVSLNRQAGSFNSAVTGQIEELGAALEGIWSVAAAIQSVRSTTSDSIQDIVSSDANIVAEETRRSDLCQRNPDKSIEYGKQKLLAISPSGQSSELNNRDNLSEFQILRNVCRCRSFSGAAVRPAVNTPKERNYSRLFCKLWKHFHWPRASWHVTNGDLST